MQAFVLVILFGKLVRKIFFGQLRAAEFEVSTCDSSGCWTGFVGPGCDQVYSELSQYIWTSLLSVSHNHIYVYMCDVVCISSMLQCFASVNFMLAFLQTVSACETPSSPSCVTRPAPPVTAPDGALVVRGDGDLSGLHHVQGRPQSQVRGALHAAALPEVVPLAGGGPRRLCESGLRVTSVSHTGSPVTPSHQSHQSHRRLIGRR